jgi:hypothetical protein
LTVFILLLVFQDFDLTLATLEHIGAVVREGSSVDLKKSTNKTIVFLSRMFEPFLVGYWVKLRPQ